MCKEVATIPSEIPGVVEICSSKIRLSLKYFTSVAVFELHSVGACAVMNRNATAPGCFY
jgi:hypothetical protein